jgi:hypothetical protein
MLSNGDKLIVTKKVAAFLDEGDIVKVVNVDESGLISFAFGEDFMHKGIMNLTECEEHFEKFVEEKKSAPSVTKEHITKIMESSTFTVDTVFDKCTIVSCKLPNGFVIVESSACVSPENYDEKIGANICMDKIENKIWELEGYLLQALTSAENDAKDEECPCGFCDGFCDDCEYHECPADEYIGDEDDIDENDMNCSNCDDYECPYNFNH